MNGAHLVRRALYTRTEVRTVLVISCIFLAAIVLLSIGTYLPYLGFYSDDWDTLSTFANSPDQSFGHLSRSFGSEQNIRVRPVYALTWVLLYKLFHFSPLGYHLCNALLLVSMALLLFGVLLELRQPLLIAISVPAVYILLPHYSTDRFWIAAIDANVSMVFYFLSFYAALRSLRSSWIWLVVCVLSTSASVLAYEMAVPLFMLNVALVLWRGHWNSRSRIAAVLIGSPLIACFLFKAAVNQRPVMTPGTFWSHAVWLVEQVIFVNFYQLGLAYPRIVWKILRFHWDLPVVVVAVLVGLAVFGFLQWLLRNQPESAVRVPWIKILVIGLLIFGLGYAVFLSTDQESFHKTGVANRTSIAAALGIAVCFIGALGWVAERFPVRLRTVVFCGGVALACASGALINDTLARYWIQAYRDETATLKEIKRSYPSLPSGTIVIVDGVCRYIGPVPFFESYWEVASALRLLYHQPDLYGDSISRDTRIGPNSLTTLDYGEERSYRYSDKLMLYNVALHQSFLITDGAAMRRYLANHSDSSSIKRNCPGYPGEGAPVF